ncbi:MAG: GntR family transcriptional regulator [Actinobacteria bacterium]|nr:GntR family transcriptional regulator [Actinomycetota bacterium]
MTKVAGVAAPSGKRGRRDESQSVSAVHDRIRDAILYARLEQGASIPQHLLASEFDAGRTPLREALRMLQREGLVVAEPNHPVRIASLSADDFEELYIRRISLEALAIRMTVPNLSSDDIAELEAAMTKMEHYHKAGDDVGFRAPHRAFHRRLVTGAGPNIAAEIDVMADHSERYRISFGIYGKWKNRRSEHRRILDAAKEGDAELAADRLGDHYANTASLVFGVLEPDRDLERLRVTLRTVAPGAVDSLSVG